MSNHYTRFEQKPNTKFQRRKRSAFHRTTPPHHCMYGLSVIVVYYLNGNTSTVYESTGPSTYEIATLSFLSRLLCSNLFHLVMLPTFPFSISLISYYYNIIFFSAFILLGFHLFDYAYNKNLKNCQQPCNWSLFERELKFES